MPVSPTAESGHHYLLTGVTGFLGKVVLEELLRRRDELGVERVFVVIRPRGPRSAAERFAREVAASPCLSRLCPRWNGFVDVVEGTLATPGLGLHPARRDEIIGRTTHVVHAAAAVDFGLPLFAATHANVTTALHLLELAASCTRLQTMVYVSTAYVTPHPGDGRPIEELLAPLPRPAEVLYESILEGGADERELLAESRHPNTYTLTKSLAEHLLVGRRRCVPLVIVRPSIISASRRHPFPGWIDSVAGLAAFVVSIGTGEMRVVSGDPDARLDLVPVDDVAARILLAAQSAPDRDAPSIHHAVAGLARSPEVRRCSKTIRDFFRTHGVGRRPALDYLGPPGLRFKLAEALHHRLRPIAGRLHSRRARRTNGRVRARVARLNTTLAYFTHRSFPFRSSAPLDESFDPGAYVTTVCRGVYRHLLGQDDTQWQLAGRRHRGHGGDARWAFRQPHGSTPIRLAAWLVTKVLRRTVDRVTVDLPSFESARQAAPEGSALVIAASHRSYLDFVLCSYLFFARPDLGIPIPYVAAASEFGRIPVLGRLLDALQAFYVARGPRRENRELMARVCSMIQAGRTIEFFIEGMRSRTREFLAPKRGLLRCLQATGRACCVLPVAISYDRVPEEGDFARELAGEPKPEMRLRGLVRWGWRASRGRVALGRVHVSCGTPVPLRPGDDVQATAGEVVAQLRRATVTTTYHLRAFLARHPIEGVDVAGLRRAIEERGGRVLESDLELPCDLDPLVAGTLRHHFAHVFVGDDPGEETRPLIDVLFGPGTRLRFES